MRALFPRIALTCTGVSCISSLAFPFYLTFGQVQEETLLGSVKNVTSHHSGFVSSQTYDRLGRLVESMLDDTRYTFEYDAQGRLLVETAFESNETIIYKKGYRYGYDDTGRERAEVAATSDGTFSHATFSGYDNRGNLESKIYFTGESFTDKALFDAFGHVIYGARYRHGTLWFETSYFFGANGLLLESRTYRADGSLSSIDMLKYDDGGRLIEETSEFFNSQNIQKSVTMYVYDSKGLDKKAIEAMDETGE